jgi:hypothetical protein
MTAAIALLFDGRPGQPRQKEARVLISCHLTQAMI